MSSSCSEDVSVVLGKPLGVVLGEVTSGGSVEVVGLQEGSNADECGLICVGDRLLSVGGRDVSALGFDLVMEALRESPSPVSLSLARCAYPDDDSPLDITANLVKSLSSTEALLTDRVVRAARSAVRLSPLARRELGRLLRVEIVVGAGVQKEKRTIKVRFFGIFTTGGVVDSTDTYSCNISATGVLDNADAVRITKLSCAKDEGWGRTIDLI